MKVRKNSTSKMPMWVSSWRTAIAMPEKHSTAPLIQRQPRTTGDSEPVFDFMGWDRSPMVRMWEDLRASPSERAVKPPFRADQVGSLLRPEALKAAREKYLGPQTPTNAIGPHHDPDLRKVEDACIREVVAMQERAGL